MRCLSCHYDLTNLTEHRCPECGRQFDPDDPSSFLAAKKYKIKTWNLIIVVALLALMARTAILRILYHLERGNEPGVLRWVTCAAFDVLVIAAAIFFYARERRE